MCKLSSLPCHDATLHLLHPHFCVCVCAYVHVDLHFVLSLLLVAAIFVACYYFRYERVKAYAATNPELKGEYARFLEHAMRDYRRLGLTLDAETRGKIEDLKKQCKALETEFHQNMAEDKSCW